MKIPEGDIDVLTIGEAVIDFVSEEAAPGLQDAEVFRRHQGGAPTNVAVNVAKLGGSSAVIAKVGIGAFGSFIRAQLLSAGVNIEYLVMDHKVHTSVVFVARTSGTPDFEAFRAGDARLSPKEVPAGALHRAKVVHSTAFALSRKPERAAVEKAFRMAEEDGRLTTLDPNYSPIVWPSRREAQEVIASLMAHVWFTKPSIDDCHRLFDDAAEPEEYIDRFHEMGANMVALTMGADGVVASDGARRFHVPTNPVEVLDATGAGDSFLAGFLVATLDGNDFERSLLFARAVVERKLQTVGPLPVSVDRQEIYDSLT
jgi:sugar/nucleoside kinase (ribokinase family)